MIAVGDTHFTYQIPVGRNDNLHGEIEAKIDFLIGLCKKDDSHLIIPGDVFDVYTLSKISVLNLNFLRSILEKFRNEGIKVLSVAGNHDGATKIDKKDSVYHLFVELGLLIDLETPYETDEYIVFGFDYGKEIVDIESDKKKVAVIHEHYLPDGEELPFIEYGHYSDLMNYDIDYFVLGHLHKGYGVQGIEGKKFINLWSFTRLHRNSYAMGDQHRPEAYIFDKGVVEIPHSPFKDSFIISKSTYVQMAVESLGEIVEKFRKSSSDDELQIPERIADKVHYYLT